MSWLTTSWANLGSTAEKAVLMYLTALVGLRLGERRTLAQWTIIDFAAAVAIGAIVGRTAIADGQSYAVGAIAIDRKRPVRRTPAARYLLADRTPLCHL